MLIVALGWFLFGSGGSSLSVSSVSLFVSAFSAFLPAEVMNYALAASCGVFGLLLLFYREDYRQVLQQIHLALVLRGAIQLGGRFAWRLERLLRLSCCTAVHCSRA